MAFFITHISGSAPGEGFSKTRAAACGSEGDLGAESSHWLLPSEWHQAPVSPRGCGALSALWPGPEKAKAGERARDSDWLDSPTPTMSPVPPCPQCLTSPTPTMSPVPNQNM